MLEPNQESIPDPVWTDYQKSLLKSFPGGIAGVSASTWKIFFMNHELEELSGYTYEELSLQASTDITSMLLLPCDRKKIIEDCHLLHKDGHMELSCQIIRKDGNKTWIKLYTRLIDHPEWGRFLLFQVFNSTEIQNAADDLNQAKMDLNILTNTIPGGVARLCITDNFRVITASDGYYQMIGYSREEFGQPPFYNQGGSLLVKEDIPSLEAAVEDLLVRHIPVNISYRIIQKSGNVVWNKAYASNIVSIDGEIMADIVFIDITSTKNIELQLSNLINSVPGSVVRFHITDSIIIDYATDKFYSQIEYSPEEFSAAPIASRYLEIIHPEDRVLVLERTSTFTETDINCPSLDYRIITKSGCIRWMRASASRLNDNLSLKRSAQCIITDVTEEKQRKRLIEINEERYRIIAEQTQDVIYEWDLNTNIFHHSPMFRKKFGYALPEDYALEDMMASDMIFREDKPLFDALIHGILGGSRFLEAEYRIKKLDGTYIWCCNSMTIVFDENSKPVQVIGVIKDIDNYKRENASLQDKARQDSLTGLLNRMAIQNLIQGILADSVTNQRHAFLLFDIDHFKNINDSYGHITGDMVLFQTAIQLFETFKDQALTGRMGGDEFSVFINDVKSVLKISQLVEEFRKRISTISPNHIDLNMITFSMGIALYPDHGTTFQELYEHADIAMYQSKKNGRNCYHIFDFEETRQ